MLILIAPDKFKGSLTAAEAAAAIARGVKRALPNVRLELFPMADGGEGTVDSLIAVAGGKILHRQVHGPLGRRVIANFGLLTPQRDVVVIEMAQASGLHLVPPRQRNPLNTSTFGTGELIGEALRLGCREIIIGIGGSATVDGGAGMAQALGVKFFDENGRELRRLISGGDLGKIGWIDSSAIESGISKLRVVVASDVQSPLLGSRGAARVFGPQKGATPTMVEQLERNLRHYARIVARDVLGDSSHFRSLVSFPGAGAAGGLGTGLRAFLNAGFVSGAEVVMRYGRFDAKLRRADLVITGEGRLDEQSLHGKVPVAVARRAKKFRLPVLALAGSVRTGSRVMQTHGIDAAVAIKPKTMNLNFAIKNAARLLEETAARTIVEFLQVHQ